MSFQVYVCIFLLLLYLLLHFSLFAEYNHQHCISRDYVRFDYTQKKSFEKTVTVSPYRVVVFHIPDFKTELLPFFDPAALINLCKRRSQYGSGLNAFGINIRSGRPVAVDNFPFLTFYQWCWNQRKISSGHIHDHHWMSFHNQRFLSEKHDGTVNLAAVMRANMDSLFQPMTLLPSAMVSGYDMLVFSHRAPSKSLPYFLHFVSRRVLTAAFGSFRLSFLPWRDAQKYVTPQDCVLKHCSSAADESEAAGSGKGARMPEWTFSPKCNLRNMITFGGFTVHEGQSVVVPPYMVYQMEHILPSSKREKFEQCCVILQADYQTASNRCKNWVSFSPFRATDDEDVRGAVSHMRDEIELQDEKWGSQHRPRATFLKPEVNAPLKEELQEQVHPAVVAAAAASAELAAEDPASAKVWQMDVLSVDHKPTDQGDEETVSDYSTLFSRAVSLATAPEKKEVLVELDAPLELTGVVDV